MSTSTTTKHAPVLAAAAAAAAAAADSGLHFQLTSDRSSDQAMLANVWHPANRPCCVAAAEAAMSEHQQVESSRAAEEFNPNAMATATAAAAAAAATTTTAAAALTLPWVSLSAHATPSTATETAARTRTLPAMALSLCKECAGAIREAVIHGVEHEFSRPDERPAINFRR
ncbi:hypothetical protein BC828DRAFT_8038 [Blastocladiella britannica]|nr:hypothetical protein BC828DRAFT_8038 [Blastocladiella britannica]